MNDQPSPSGLESKSQDLPKVILTSEQERKLWQKIDVRLLPVISLMYLLSFMDRGGYFTNVCSSECGCPYYPQEISVSSCELHVESYLFYIGNAKIEGLMTQLHLTGNRFNVALVRHHKSEIRLLKCHLRQHFSLYVAPLCTRNRCG